MKKILCLVLAMSMGSVAFAAEYRTKQPIAYDWLKINGNQFNIESANERGHICSAQGEMDKNKVWKDGEGCQISFQFKGDEVKVDAEGCENYCGAGVSFPSEYYKLPQVCSQQSVKKMENRFQTTLRSGKFEQAADIKQNYLKQCGDFLNPMETVTAANDAADAYRQANNKAACIQTLDAVQDHYESELLDKDLVNKINVQMEREKALRQQCS